MNILQKLNELLDNRKTYFICALWLLGWWASQNGYLTLEQYQSIFGETGPVWPLVLATIRQSIGDNK